MMDNVEEFEVWYKNGREEWDEQFNVKGSHGKNLAWNAWLGAQEAMYKVIEEDKERARQSTAKEIVEMLEEMQDAKHSSGMPMSWYEGWERFYDIARLKIEAKFINITK